jgi:hypothetical protein
VSDLPALLKWIRERFHPQFRGPSLPSSDVQLVLPAFRNFRLDTLESDVASAAGAGAGSNTFVRLSVVPEDRIAYIYAADANHNNASAVDVMLGLEQGTTQQIHGLASATLNGQSGARLFLRYPVYVPAGWRITAHSTQLPAAAALSVRSVRVLLLPGESLQH